MCCGIPVRIKCVHPHLIRSLAERYRYQAWRDVFICCTADRPSKVGLHFASQCHLPSDGVLVGSVELAVFDQIAPYDRAVCPDDARQPTFETRHDPRYRSYVKQCPGRWLWSPADSSRSHQPKDSGLGNFNPMVSRVRDKRYFDCARQRNRCPRHGRARPIACRHRRRCGTTGCPPTGPIEVSDHPATTPGQAGQKPHQLAVSPAEARLAERIEPEDGDEGQAL